MAKKVKIESTIQRRFGKTIIAPVDGEITLDEKGQVEVSQACAEALVQGDGWRIAGSKKSLVKENEEEEEEDFDDGDENFDPDGDFEEEEETEDEDEDEDEEEEEEEESDLEEVITTIKDMKRLKDLRAYCYDSLGLTQEDIEEHDDKLKDLKKFVIAYVTEQAQESEEENDEE